MARDHARLSLSIWNDDDFRELTTAAQHLYFVFLTSRHLSYCGVADWRPNRITPLAQSWDQEEFDAAAHELATKLYIVVDEETEEVLVRSFIRGDGLMKQPKMAVAMSRAFELVASKWIRGVIIHELHRLREDEPDLNGWGSAEASKLLAKDPINPSVYPSGYPSINPSSNPSGKGKPDPSAKGCPTPYSLLPTPNSSTPSLPKEAPRSRGVRLSGDWEPSDSVNAQMREERPDINLESELMIFRDYWIAQPGAKGVKVDWDATWRNWVRRSNPSMGPAATPGVSKQDVKINGYLERGQRLADAVRNGTQKELL